MFKSAVKVGNITKKIAEQTKSNEELVKINGNLKDNIQKIKGQNEYWKNQFK